ncbi:MAG: hypothetical protein AT713_00015 [Caldivirga sp. JCHS_4]|jgi:hypothetical protein|nr:MAG: hypothetical protein AT713_00015 [Caldivirga sp. JCHS_4]
MNTICLALRILALLALIGFLAVGFMFALEPRMFTGQAINSGSALWHGLSLAFMATVSAIAFMIVWDPRKFWPMLLPLALGKLTSSSVSLYYYSTYGSFFLLVNGVTDGLIGLIAIAFFIACWISSKSS